MYLTNKKRKYHIVYTELCHYQVIRITNKQLGLRDIFAVAINQEIIFDFR